jgi:hypothetical protein
MSPDPPVPALTTPVPPSPSPQQARSSRRDDSDRDRKAQQAGTPSWEQLDEARRTQNGLDLSWQTGPQARRAPHFSPILTLILPHVGLILTPHLTPPSESTPPSVPHTCILTIHSIIYPDNRRCAITKYPTAR